MTRTARPWATLVLFLVASISPAVATATDEAADIRLKKAQATLDLATVMFREGRFAEALAELQQAEPLVDGTEVHPLVRFNIARCHEELGQLPDAVRAYERYLELTDANAKRRARAATAVAQLTPQAQGGLAIECVAPGARVTIGTLLPDGAPCPVEIKGVFAGQYAVTVTADGFAPETRQLRVKAGEVARVRVESARIEPTPTTAVVAPVKETSSNDIWGWVLIGGGVASAVTGGILHAAAEAPCENFDELDDNGNKIGTACIVVPGAEAETPTSAYVAYGVGGALVVAGVVLLLMDDAPDPQATVVPTGNGILVRF